MIIDIVFFSLLVIGIVVGIFLRNPIMCGIHLVLYVGFTYGFYYLLVYLMPIILNAFNVSLESLGAEIVSYLGVLNTELSGVGSSLGFDPYLFEGVYLESAYYNEVALGAISYVCFIASALVSFILAYAFSWAIYAIIKATALKDKDIFENKKWLKRTLGGVITAIHVFAFLLFAISPYYQLAERGAEVSSSLHYMGNKENLSDSYDDIKLLLLEADGMISETENTKGELEEMIDYIDETLKDVDTLKSQANEMETTLDSYKSRSNALINNPKVPSSDKTHLREVVNEIDEVIASIEDARTEAEEMENKYMDDIDNIKEQYATFVESFEAAKQEIEEYDSYCATLESTFDTIEEAGDQLDEYLVYVPTGSFLSSLFNLDLGYSSASNINLLEEYENILNEVLHLYNVNISSINEAMDSLYLEGKESIDGMKEELDGLNSQIEESKAEFDKYREEVDNALNEANTLIEETNQRIQELDEELDKLEAQYN